MAFLEVQNICKKIGEEVVLDQISFQQKPLENLVIAGETGSGKTTLIQIIGGFGQSDEGTVLLEGKKVWGAEQRLLSGEDGVAYLTQQHELPQHLRVEQALEYANELQDGEAEKLYQICRITHLMKRKTHALSGGEKQRIGLARLLTTKPKLLLMDEPYSNLDTVNKQIFQEVLRDLSETLKITMIMIAHDAKDTLSWADRIIVLNKGKIVQTGSPEDIYKQPNSAYVAGLFGKYNIVPADIFPTMKTTSSQGKNILLRPEQLKIVRNGGISCIVTACLFYGAYYELYVQHGDATILMYHNERVAAGTDVEIMLQRL